MSLTVRLRPPLIPRARSGARLGGAVGFGLLTVGWSLFITPIVLAVAATTAAFFLSAFDDNPDDTTVGNAQSLLGALIGAGFAIPLVASVIVGILLMVGAVIASLRILRSHGVTRAAGVTWAGIGISIVASWIVGAVLGGIGTVVASALSDPTHGFGTAYWVALGATALLDLVADIAIGCLVWWWMAHALRPFSYA
jgi:hypothetical protein